MTPIIERPTSASIAPRRLLRPAAPRPLPERDMMIPREAGKTIETPSKRVSTASLLKAERGRSAYGYRRRQTRVVENRRDIPGCGDGDVHARHAVRCAIARNAIDDRPVCAPADSRRRNGHRAGVESILPRGIVDRRRVPARRRTLRAELRARLRRVGHRNPGRVRPSVVTDANADEKQNRYHYRHLDHRACGFAGSKRFQTSCNAVDGCHRRATEVIGSLIVHGTGNAEPTFIYWLRPGRRS